MKSIVMAFSVFLIFANLSAKTNRDTITIAEDLELVKLSDNAYIHVSYKIMEKWGKVGANGMVYIEDNKAFLFDSPWSNEQTEALISYFDTALNIEFVGFIPNHWHIDAMGGLEIIQQHHIKSYANQITIDSASTRNLPSPEYGFTDSLFLKFGSGNIECYYFGGAHSTDNIAIYIPSEKILFAGCMVKSMRAKNLGNTVDGDLNTYGKVLNELLNHFPEALIVVPGHGNYGGVDLIHHTLSLLP